MLASGGDQFMVAPLKAIAILLWLSCHAPNAAADIGHEVSPSFEVIECTSHF
jgi:hypothetical protein